MTQTIETEIAYLAAFETHRTDPAVFALILTPNLDPTDPRLYDIAKVRLPLAKNSASNAGSTRALRWALNYISPSVDTILRYSTPYEPDDIDLSSYPRLELQAVSRLDNPAFHQLTRAAGAVRAA